MLRTTIDYYKEIKLKVSDIYRSTAVKPGLKLRNTGIGNDYLLIISGPSKFNLLNINTSEVWSWDGFHCKDVWNISKQELFAAFNISSDWKTLDCKPIESLFSNTNEEHIHAGQQFRRYNVAAYRLVLCEVCPTKLVMANINYNSIVHHPQVVKNYNNVTKEEFMALTASTSEKDLENWEVVS